MVEPPAGCCACAVIVGREPTAEAATMAVPLKIDVGIGRNWDEAH